MATTKILLYTTNRKKDGTSPLLIRVIQDRKSRYIKLGVYLRDEDWDDQRKRVKKSHPNAPRINNLIIKKLAETDDVILEASINQKEISSAQIRKTVKRGGTRVSFFTIAEERRQDYLITGKYSVANTDKSRTNVFRKFLKE